jgi:Ser/Thr protein kinase RdoA (MazF antagonist)
LEDRVAARFDRDTADEIREAFASVRSTRLPVATIHGDPTPHNVFWHRRSGQGTLIDFNGRTSVALDDILVVEAGLELMARRVPYSRPSKADRLIRSFRTGYRSAGVHDPIPIDILRPLKLGYYCHLLDRIVRAPSPATLQQRVTRFTDAPIIERRILALLETIDG